MTVVRGTTGQHCVSGASSSINLPAGILGGDLILLFVNINNIAGTTISSNPAGYTQLGGAYVLSTSMQSGVFWKIAAGVQGAASSDASAAVTVTYSVGSPSAEFHSLVLDGGSASNPVVLASTGVSDIVGLATHIAPSQAFAGSNKAVVEHIADKSATPGTAWTVPGGFTKQKDSYGTGAGACTAVTALNNADTATSPAGGDTYTETTTAAQAINWTIVITPAINGVFGGGGASVSDAKYNLLKATNVSLGYPTFESMADLEFAFYSNQSGLGTGAKNSIHDHKKAFYIAKGQASGSIVLDEIAFMQSKGALGTSYSSIRQDFYQNRSLV